jgi:hypothetical protein
MAYSAPANKRSKRQKGKEDDWLKTVSLKYLINIQAIMTGCFVVPPRNDGSFNGQLA